MPAPGAFEIVTAPAAEPLTIVEAKAHARVMATHEDALFTRLIAAARGHVEQQCGVALITQTWRVRFDEWPARGMKLRPHPVQSVEAVRVWDGAELAEQDVAGFQLLSGRPALIVAGDAATPATPTRSRQGIEIEFVAGYGDAGDDVPAELRQAMLLLIAHWYENREPTAISQNLSVVGDVKFTVDHLLSPFRSLRVA